MRAVLGAILWLLATFALARPAHAETGYDLWLRYQPRDAATVRRVAPRLRYVVADGSGPTVRAAVAELDRGLAGLIGSSPVHARAVSGKGGVVLATAGSPLLKGMALPLGSLGREGFLIRSASIRGAQVTLIAANSDVGLLYGTFRLLKLVQLGEPVDALDVQDAPRLQLRVLDHWDNLDRYVERGYAGQSLWDWQKLPGYTDPRTTDYARANAAIGINAVVPNNVNANADILTAPYLQKVKALAAVFRPYGIRIYLTARFSAPIEIGGLKTADPLDPAVRAWWKAKADEIYAVIPDFGGFLVKANSEGQPGPSDYNRSHADGANMLADALAPHGGVVMWRAFVYSEHNDADRHKQANDEFVPLDGQFRDNVLLQVKNGAIDFQPREPFHPLFGAMPKTPMMLEVQITKEYLGFATHLAYLGTMWEEVLQSDTFRPRAGSTVARVLETPVAPGALTGMAGVANIGTDINWSGSQFDQANWYAFGRLAWDPEAKAADIARDWARLTWSTDPAVVDPIVAMMLESREAVVNYMTPLGLGHVMATGHHYGPGPWVSNLARPEWNPTYYHRADANGIGFDRTPTGTNALGQYAPELAKLWGDLKTVPDSLLLWFHHVPWDYRMRSGEILWDSLVAHYDTGIATVEDMQRRWAGLEGKVDARRWAEVRDFLAIQRQEAQWWRDASIAYWQSLSKRPLPAGHLAPPQPLGYYQAIRTPHAPGNGK
ncbi:Extracellular xylan exo-alpha-(1-_2)-glucuronosidase [Sphingomonas sp. S2M10]|uniref:alpha-glucuronidase family glycosyl hydrolase n=1 Tax=Sphingomonas sp. S2M10 TaxID=2705010 RepID=UPI001456EA5C|nr:alpha-glucuronidase family glycosyl hydrolase [Sphingomonas sp. S2M10]NLS27252.1 Extracellular xylan exo-alpha-(1->2)-glucuronosidase [Sphingomonas sp. S2M10]